MLFCKCGSIINNGLCTNKHCETRNESLSSWLIHGISYRFRRPLTITEAMEAVKDKSTLVIKFKAPDNTTVKPYTG